MKAFENAEKADLWNPLKMMDQHVKSKNRVEIFIIISAFHILHYPLLLDVAVIKNIFLL
jgi:hypothetical protein